MQGRNRSWARRASGPPDVEFAQFHHHLAHSTPPGEPEGRPAANAVGGPQSRAVTRNEATDGPIRSATRVTTAE